MKPIKRFIQNCQHEWAKLSLLSGSWHLVLIWPLLGTVLAGVLWGVALNRLNTEQSDILKTANADAAILAMDYANQVEQSLESVDALSSYVRNEWQRSGGTLRLEALQEEGLFGATCIDTCLIIGPNGDVLATTVPHQKTVSFVDRDYFIFHKHSRSALLRVSTPGMGKISGKSVINLSRRIENPDGSFAGVLVMSVLPDFFAPASSASLFGKSEIAILIGDDLQTRVSRLGIVSERPQVTMLKTPDFVYKTSAKAALAHTLDGTWFSDGRPRIVAAEKLSAYPFRVLVGLAQEDVLSLYLKTSSEVITAGYAGSAVLAFFVLAAVRQSIRLFMRKAGETELHQAYRIATEGGNEGFFLWKALRDPGGFINDFEVVDCNERGAELYGMEKAELTGKSYRSLYAEPFASLVVDLHRDAFDRGFYEDYYKVPSSSRLTTVWVYRKIVRTRAGLAITLRDVSQMRANEDEMTRRATKDTLTGLPNRYWLTKNLPEKLKHADKNGASLALLFLDLDDFKNVNDSLGHSAGDDLLKAAAARLRSLVRPSDIAVRLGGDEFTIIIDPVESPEQVEQVASRIVQAFKKPFVLKHGSNYVGASIGIGLYPQDGQDAETLTQHADIAMYSAKTNKGRFCFYESIMSERIIQRLGTEQELLQALEKDQFVVYYQPRGDTATGKVVGLEALVRWNHPIRGLVMPDEFIPVAESTGLILQLGAVVMRKVCAQIAAWREQKIPVVPVSVNVSARQFNQGDVKKLISHCLLEFQLEATLIEVELTESVMINECAQTLTALADISAMGVKLHVDDFGTGYSSLSLLQSLNLDVLKVDRAFTSTLGTSSESEIFFRAIVSMAHALGMSVVAEGVETKAQLRVLQRLQCDEVQGYYLSRPVPACEIPALMRQRTLFPGSPQLVLGNEELRDASDFFA